MADVVQLTAATTQLTAPIGSIVVTVYPREKLDEERVDLFAGYSYIFPISSLPGRFFSTGSWRT